MPQQRILAIDFGYKRIGLALTDPLGMIAQPLPYLKNKGIPGLLACLKDLIKEKGVEKIVFGLPLNLDGSLGVKAREYQTFAHKIETACGVPVETVDESFTSRESDEILIEELDVSRKKRKKVRDSLAACLILKSYLSRL